MWQFAAEHHVDPTLAVTPGELRTWRAHGDDLAEHAVAQGVLPHHLKLVGGGGRQPLDGNLRAAGRGDGDGRPVGGPCLTVPAAHRAPRQSMHFYDAV